MMGAVLSFSTMAVLTRYLVLSLDSFEILTYRSAVSIAVVLLYARLAGTLHQIKAVALPVYFGRNVAHFAGQNLWIMAAPLIPLSQLFALEFTYPILVALGASLFLGEKLTPLRIGTAALGLLGIVIVAQPFGGAMNIGLLFAFLCAFGFAGSALFTKHLTKSPHGTVTNILFWLSLMHFVFGLICGFADGEMAWFTPYEAALIVPFALAGLFAHFCLTTALSLAPASVVTPIDFLRLPLIAFIALLIFGEPTSTSTFLGAALIFAANYANVLGESRRAKRSRKS